jgi:hypothetical protein
MIKIISGTFVGLILGIVIMGNIKIQPNKFDQKLDNLERSYLKSLDSLGYLILEVGDLRNRVSDLETRNRV